MRVSGNETSVCIVGTGYVGMASAIGFAALGHHARGYDIDVRRVRALQSGVTPYREDGIEEALREHLQSGRIAFFEDLAEALAGARYAVIAVGTPAREDGSADVAAVERAVAAIRSAAAPGTLVVLRSTVPPGTTERFEAETGLPFVFAPEFLREGSAVADFLNPDRIVIGASSPANAEAFAQLVAPLQRPVITTGFRNAELIKGLSNAYLAMKISFANEVANLCDVLDADALAVLHGIGCDTRIGRAFLQPGIGFGGPCFEKDVRSLHHLATCYGTSRELLAATLRVNTRQPQYIVDVLESELGGLAGTHVAVWGLTFKAGTDDLRDSLALRIVADLIARGALPIAYDPTVRASGKDAELPCQIAASALDAVENADALLVLTEWPEFASIPVWAYANRLRRGVVVDGRNVLDPDALADAGVRYRGVGRKAGGELSLAEAS